MNVSSTFQHNGEHYCAHCGEKAGQDEETSSHGRVVDRVTHFCLACPDGRKEAKFQKEKQDLIWKFERERDEAIRALEKNIRKADPERVLKFRYELDRAELRKRAPK